MLLGTVENRQVAVGVALVVLVVLAVCATTIEWPFGYANVNTLQTEQEEYRLTAEPLFYANFESLLWGVVVTDPRGHSFGPWVGMTTRVVYTASVERVDVAHNIFGGEVAIVLHLHPSRLKK